MERSPNCTENCLMCKACVNRSASLEALILTVGYLSARVNISIDKALANIISLLEGVESGQVPEPDIRCPDGNDAFLLREGHNLLIERKATRDQLSGGNAFIN